MAAMPDLALSIVIPVYGSAGILPALASALQAALDPQVGAGRYEVILVHDQGPDDAWRVISDLATTRPWLRGVELRKNAGQHNAVMAGLAFARGEYIVTMDDDLQHDPQDVPRILACLREGRDVCYVQFASRRHALWKRLGSAFNDLVAGWLLRKPRGLYLSPFRGLHHSIRDLIVVYTGPFVYVDGLLLQSTANIGTIEAQHHARSDGRSGYSLRKSISLWLQMATSFSIMPLRAASLAGMACSLFGFALALFVIVEKFLHPDTPVGWTSLIVAILMMGGIQLIALGMIGEYVGRVLLNVSYRPQYVLGRRVNLPDADLGTTPRDDH
ncbi:glycosyltransferase [Arenimonas oryziterrae]|uniref:Glycosyltransferase 2-like domain-containing protein n=1 Tax=Arenimonas oryziterrae DSM 21050 = YC6267 TaxID=1121015 RepID=A0A091AVX2_9GAMM|nr:glycosyltransferase [Arenimonas oryziterrae]KFN42829.1 hypothetical protein N789_11910 [Arenimonas oryziterrae DSM 21050 = YC6267]